MPELTPAGEALAAPLRRRLLQRFPADRAYPRAALRTEGMPPPVAAFLDRTLDRWVEMERERFREEWAGTEWFDTDDAAVQRSERAFFDALSRSARVPAEAWEDTLGGAVDLVVRFLTVPARALTDAIFEGAPDPLPAEVIRARLSLFDAYPYLTEVATAYFDRKRPETLDPSDLFALLDRIDRRFVSEYGLEDWLALLTPLFVLARHAPPLDGVPMPVLQRFFEAKGEDDLADLVAEHGGAVLDEAALRAVLAPAFSDAASEASEDAEPELNESDVAEQATTPERDERAADEAESPHAETSTSVEDTDEPVEVPEAATSDPELPAEPPPDEHLDEPQPPAAEPEPYAPADPNTARPLWERFAERTADGDSVNARFGPPEPDAEHEAPADDTNAAPLWKRFFARPDAEAPTATTTAKTGESAPAIERAPAEPTPSAHSTDVHPTDAQSTDSLDALERRVLGPMPPAQRKRFVKHLFGGDAGKYVTVLHALEAADSWTEASQIIARDVFRPSRINIYGEHAVAFTDAVEGRFRE